MGRSGAWLAALCLVWLVVGWTAPAMGAHTSGYAAEVKHLNRQEIQERAAKGAGQVVAIDGGTSAGLIKSGGIKSWLADHGMGLVKGIGAGLIGAAVVVGGAALIVGAAAPLLLMAGSAVVGGALYGALTGSAHFSWAEAIAGSLIGGASAGMGSWIAGMGSRFATRIGVAAVEMVVGGVINTIGYLIHETHRTLGGALAAFGVGAGAAALFMGAGAVVGRVWRWSESFLGFGRRTTSTATAIILVNEERLIQYAKKITPLPDYLDVVIHGNEGTVGVGVQTFDHRWLAKYLTQHGYQGRNIRLISCSTGKLSDGLAQNLANKLRVEVLAPTDTLYVFRNGKMTIGPDPYSNTGFWKVFQPRSK